ncbi:MAG: helix-turn-helix domain-containing protein [Pseudomonadota bacterium]
MRAIIVMTEQTPPLELGCVLGLAAAARTETLLVSATGGAVPLAQNLFADTLAADDISGAVDCIVILSGPDASALSEAPLGKHLRYWLRQEKPCLAVGPAVHALARLGVLEGLSVAVPQGDVISLSRTHADVTALDTLMACDGRVFTCAGGAAALDAMQLFLSGIAQAMDASPQEIAEACLAPPPRPLHTPQRPPVLSPGDSAPGSLHRAVAEMEGALDTPRPIPEIAQAIGLSQRQMERLFLTHLGATPAQHYRAMRLTRARRDVTDTTTPIVDIAGRHGFSNAVHFSRAYKQLFGRPPQRDRILARRKPA